MTLADGQERIARRGLSVSLAGSAVMIGWLFAWLTGMLWMPDPGGELTLVVTLHLCAFLLMMLGMLGGSVLMMRDQRAMLRRLDAALTRPALAGPAVPARLVRVIRAKGSRPLHQLLYAAHIGDAVEPVAAVLPRAVEPPAAGTGAWLVIDPEQPDIAQFAAVAEPGDHETALRDPALHRLTRVQRGLAFRPRAYRVPGMVAAVAFVLSFALFTAVLVLFS